MDLTGNHFYIPLADNPIMNCSDGCLLVSWEKDSFSLELCNLLCFQFVEDAPDNYVDAIKNDNNRVDFKMGHFYIECKDKGVIEIYSIAGMKIKSYQYKGGILDIDVTNLNNGQYILKGSKIISKFSIR